MHDPELVPEHQAQNGVWHETEKRGAPALVETPQPLTAEYLHEAVTKVTVYSSTTTTVDWLVVQACRDDVKWRHAGNDDTASTDAATERVQNTVWLKELKRQ